MKRYALSPNEISLFEKACDDIFVNSFFKNMNGNDINPYSFFDTPVRSLCLEIGFGKGENLVGQAEKNTDVGFLGCDLFRDGILATVRSIRSANLKNVKIFYGDARIFLETIMPAQIERVFMLFPDPWPKRRQHHKRLFSDDFLVLLKKIIKPHGCFILATDSQEYFQYIQESLAQQNAFVIDFCREGLPDDVFETSYYKKSLKKGNKVFSLSMRLEL